MRRLLPTAFFALATLLPLATLPPLDAWAQPGSVLGEQKITRGVGGFSGPLQNHDWFGLAVEDIGDFNEDGVPDLAVGGWKGF